MTTPHDPPTAGTPDSADAAAPLAAAGTTHGDAAAGITTTLRSDGLTCPSCVARIERALERLDGVRSASVAFASGRIDVEHVPGLAPEALVEALARLGYRARATGF